MKRVRPTGGGDADKTERVSARVDVMDRVLVNVGVREYVDSIGEVSGFSASFPYNDDSWDGKILRER